MRLMTRKKYVSAFLLILVAIICITPVGSAEESLDSYLHRSNIVFVTDESLSMMDTDPNNNRHDAIRLFLGEMANSGNYAGSVSFAGDLVDESAIQHMDGQGPKDALLSEISSQEYAGFTNIGKALYQAVELLDNGRNRELDSSIIILTDGNTEMPDEKALQESAKMKADAIERARQQGYRIHCICLNVDGSADPSELRQIAQATEGEFAEIDDSGDLNDVETLFNKLIFHSFEDEDFTDLEFVIGEDGTVETEFTIPNIGVEEINVLFEGRLSDCSLTDPDGKVFKKGEAGAVIVSGGNFILAKVPQPKGGTWRARAYGDPNTTIGLRILYNSDFFVTAELNAPSTNHVGDTVDIIARLGDSAGIVSDVSRYSDVECSAHILYAGEENIFPMQITADGFLYQLTLNEEGTYYVSVSASRKDMEAVAEETFEINVNNSAPVVKMEELTAHANIWPFIGGSASVELTGAAEDPEGQEITYTVKSSAFNEEDYTLEGDKLTVNNFSIPKGSFEIEASDPYGAYCTFHVQFTSTNIGLIMAIVMLIGILIALVVIVLLIRAAMGQALIGSLSVAEFHPGRTGVPSVINHGRGRISLNVFTADSTMLPPGCKFQCNGKKRQVLFISKQPVYSDNMIGANKKIQISGDKLPVRISSSEDMEDGIQVIFESDIQDYI